MLHSHVTHLFFHEQSQQVLEELVATSGELLALTFSLIEGLILLLLLGYQSHLTPISNIQIIWVQEE